MRNEFPLRHLIMLVHKHLACLTFLQTILKLNKKLHHLIWLIYSQKLVCCIVPFASVLTPPPLFLISESLFCMVCDWYLSFSQIAFRVWPIRWYVALLCLLVLMSAIISYPLPVWIFLFICIQRKCDWLGRWLIENDYLISDSFRYILFHCMDRRSIDCFWIYYCISIDSLHCDVYVQTGFHFLELKWHTPFSLRIFFTWISIWKIIYEWNS